MKKSLIQAALFLAAFLIGVGILRAFDAPAVRMGQPMTLDGTQYVAQLYFPGGYGAIAFDSREAMEQFARMPGVTVEKRARVQIARSEVVVEAKR